MSAVESNRSTTGFAATPVQKAALVVGIVFLLVGIAGFIPGVTSNYDQLMFAGHGSGAMLLGVFQVSILHNIVHLLFGVVGIAVAKTIGGSRGYLIWGGVIYAILWLYGLFVAEDSMANFVPLNNADDWLHLVLFVGMVVLGLVLPPKRNRARA